MHFLIATFYLFVGNLIKLNNCYFLILFVFEIYLLHFCQLTY
jgi:hypothetical protein